MVPRSTSAREAKARTLSVSCWAVQVAQLSTTVAVTVWLGDWQVPACMQVGAVPSSDVEHGPPPLPSVLALSAGRGARVGPARPALLACTHRAGARNLQARAAPADRGELQRQAAVGGHRGEHVERPGLCR